MQQQESLTPYLRLLSSNNVTTNEHAAKFIILQSTINPQLILKSCNDIFILIKSITSTDHPKWGVVSSLVFALSNSINLQLNLFMGNRNPDPNLGMLITLIQISQTITQSYFSSADESCISPFLLPFSQTLKKIFTNRTVFQRELLLAISDHCAVGFVHGASFIPFLVKSFDNILATFLSFLNFPLNDFSRLSQPISSPNKDVVIFYLTLWSCSLPDLLKSPEVLQYLRGQSRKILELIDLDEIPFRSPAVYLLDCVKSFSQERSTLVQRGKERKVAWFNALNSYIEVSLKQKEETVESYSNPMNKAKSTSKVQRLFEIPADIMVKKKMKRFYLYFVPDAKVFAWSPNTDLKQANYLHITEIESANLDNLNQNLLNVKTFKNDLYTFQFNSTVYSKLFSDALSSH